MAEKSTESTELAAAIALLAKALTQQGDKQNDILAALHKSQPPRVVEYGDPDYQAELAKTRKEWKTPTFQNGIEANPQNETPQTIARVAELRAGHYIKNMVEVQVSPKGHVNFLYKNKTPDQRFAMQVEFRNFGEMVDRIWAEMQAQMPKAS